MLLINASNLNVGGGMQVGISVINELTSDKRPFVAAVSLSVFKQLSEEAKLNAIIIEKSPSGLLNFDVRKKLDQIVIENNIDKVFTIFGPSYWSPRVSKHMVGFALPWLIYDTHEIYKTLSVKEKLKKQLLRFLQPYYFKKNADIIVTETEDVSEKVAKLLNYNSKFVFTVSNTVSDVYGKKELYDQTIIQRLPLKKPEDIWLLCISHNYPHKNLECIKALIKRLPEHYKFITTVEPSFLDDVPDNLKDRVVTLGTVSIYQCPPLYEMSDALFLPTLLECFSASYAEAMFMEKTILTSDKSFARTICSEAAYYFDPLNIEDMANKTLSAFSDDLSRVSKIETGKQLFNAIPNARQRAQKYMSILYGNR